MSDANKELQSAIFGSGCFWCTEAIFQELRGVRRVEPGYSGGHVDGPTYEQVCTAATGHAEVCRVTYDSQEISYWELLEVFWKTHDPTTPNRQGNDAGPQYRSVIFYLDEQQRTLAENMRDELNAAGIWADPIVTEISPFKNFYPAEEYHHNYFRTNPAQPYCLFVISPKLEKFKRAFAGSVKKQPQRRTFP